MRKSVIVCACAMLALGAAEASAQWSQQPLDGRLLVSVNVGGQAGSTEVVRQSSFEIYDERAQVESSQTLSAGGVFDVGATYRVGTNFGANWGVGLAYSASGGSGDATVNGSVPHPVFFDRSRPFSATLEGLDTHERAVHLQAVLFVPFVEGVDFTFAAGPSFFTAEQGFSRGISFTEVGPNFDVINVEGVEIVNVKESGTGFNLSGDATYRITDVISAGLTLRYTRATVDMELGDGNTVEARPGGFQVLVGARLRF